MKLSQQSQAIIESAIQKAINKYTCGCEQTIVTDIHMSVMNPIQKRLFELFG